MQVKRMVISTYQAASGAGQAAMDELELQTKEVLEGKEVTKNIFPFQVIANACKVYTLKNRELPFGCAKHVSLLCFTKNLYTQPLTFAQKSIRSKKPYRQLMSITFQDSANHHLSGMCIP